MLKSLLLSLCLVACPALAADMSNVKTVTDAQGVVHGTGLLKGGLKGLTKTYESLPADKLPDSFDLRAMGMVSPIKNQGQCGSCWAHGTTESLEDAILFAGLPGLQLSVQQATFCNDNEYGCGGGFMTSADYLVNPGLALDSAAPYDPGRGGCPNAPVAAKAKSWSFVGAEGRAPTTDEIKTALVAHGSVFVTVSAGGYDWNGQAEMTECGNSGTNHIVEIVGWRPNAGGEWIMRNSWGTDWGDKGFAYMPYGCDGIAGDSDSAAFTVY